MTQPQSQQQLHAIVHGRVQGVGFRAATQGRAAGLGLTGWVRNQADGSVEVVAEGERDPLERFVAYLNSGPKSAHVTHVDLDWRPAAGSFTHFGIR